VVTATTATRCGSQLGRHLWNITCNRFQQSSAFISQVPTFRELNITFISHQVQFNMVGPVFPSQQFINCAAYAQTLHVSYRQYCTLHCSVAATSEDLLRVCGYIGKNSSLTVTQFWDPARHITGASTTSVNYVPWHVRDL
jgi:hypothetical protein